MGSAKHDSSTFGDDSGRYGFWSALRKRLFGFKIGGKSWRWSRLVAQDQATLTRLFKQALMEDPKGTACWVFEAMLSRSGGLAACIKVLSSTLARNDEVAAKQLEGLLPALVASGESLTVSMSVRMLYLFGVACLARAQGAQGARQDDLELYRGLAVEFFERARALAPQEQQEQVAQAPYRQQGKPDYAYTDERIAANYEQAVYLVWIPPVVMSRGSSSATGDGG